MGEAARRENTRVGPAVVALFVGLFSFAALESVARIVVGPSSTIAALIGVLIIVVALWRQSVSAKGLDLGRTRSCRRDGALCGHPVRDGARTS